MQHDAGPQIHKNGKTCRAIPHHPIVPIWGLWHPRLCGVLQETDRTGEADSRFKSILLFLRLFVLSIQHPASRMILFSIAFFLFLEATSALAQINGTTTISSTGPTYCPPVVGGPEVHQTEELGYDEYWCCTPTTTLTLGPEAQQTIGMVLVDGCGHTSTVPPDNPQFPTETNQANTLSPVKDSAVIFGLGALLPALPFFV
ncbi:hypothetical protein BJY01DRAFT_100359 [Aspergillus pseudoustus]|uniref:Uncharacterized protein n=1 Tax=Aspergillus pseudoustus TaxID=1810923 RepID=A0ABR4KLB8_9EURO